MLGDECAERRPVLGEGQQREKVPAAQKKDAKAGGDDGRENPEARMAGPRRCPLAIDGRLSEPFPWIAMSLDWINPNS
jgi:hypothetical protein